MRLNLYIDLRFVVLSIFNSHLCFLVSRIDDLERSISFSRPLAQASNVPNFHSAFRISSRCFATFNFTRRNECQTLREKNHFVIFLSFAIRSGKNPTDASRDYYVIIADCEASVFPVRELLASQVRCATRQI